MNKIGLIFHGPYSQSTNKLINNAIKAFNLKDIVYVTNDQISKFENFGKIKVISSSDPGELKWLGKKAINLLRHMENVKTGCIFLQDYKYLFKIRSDLKLNANDFINLKKSADKNINKLIKIRNLTTFIPFHDLDFLYGAPNKVMLKSCEIVLYELDNIFKIFLYNKYRPFKSVKLLFDSEMIIDLSLWLSIKKLSFDQVLTMNTLYDYKNYIKDKNLVYYFNLNKIRTFPKRLSPLNTWYLKAYLFNYLLPILLRKINNIIFNFQIGNLK